MKEIFLSQAKENGHQMARVSPGRYECSQCAATVEDDQTGCDNWQSSKTGNLCPKAGIEPVENVSRELLPGVGSEITI